MKKQPPNNLKKLRLERKWSTQKLAELSNLGTGTINRLENGVMKMTTSYMNLFAEVFKVAPIMIISEGDAHFPDNTTSKTKVAEHSFPTTEKNVYQSALIREVCASPPKDIEAKIAAALNKYNEEFKKTTGVDPSADSVRSYLISIKSLFTN